MDTNGALPDITPPSISHALIHVLAALPVSLVPAQLQRSCLEAEDRDEGYAILEGVEGVHTNVSHLNHESTLIHNKLRRVDMIDPDRVNERCEAVYT